MDTIDKINYYLSMQGKTGADLSRALGLSNSVYSQWNTRKTAPRKSKLPAIAEYLGVNVDDLDDNTPLENIKKSAVPQDDGHTDYVDIASRRIRCARPISILAVQYGVPTYLMQQIIGCDFNRAEGLCVGRYEPIEAELRKVSETFCIPYDELIQGWVPLSANPDVFSRIALYTSYPSPSQEGQE